MASSQQIIALGGGGFSMERSAVLDEYVLAAAGRPRPRICFLPTASGDSDNYIVRFYERFTALACEPTHLELFGRTTVDIEAFLRSHDIVFVGGGSAANMLAVWKLHGMDTALRAALTKGTVLAGVSAGSLCWFEAGVTDSYGPLAPIQGLGFIGGSNCPHYDGDPCSAARFSPFRSGGHAGGSRQRRRCCSSFRGRCTLAGRFIATKCTSVSRRARRWRARRGPLETEYIGG